jgi:Ca2+-binding EF-hand superfamily protein
MKKCLIVALLGAATAAYADPVDDAFDRIDKNHDGTITEAELTAAADAMFEKMDGDDDGKITVADFAKAAAEPPKDGSKPATLADLVPKHLEAAAADGKLTRDEFVAGATRLVDGMVPENVRALRQKGRKLPADKAWAAESEKAFDALDADHDGALTLADYAAQASHGAASRVDLAAALPDWLKGAASGGAVTKAELERAFLARARQAGGGQTTFDRAKFRASQGK